MNGAMGNLSTLPAIISAQIPNQILSPMVMPFILDLLHVLDHMEGQSAEVIDGLIGQLLLPIASCDILGIFFDCLKRVAS